MNDPSPPSSTDQTTGDAPGLAAIIIPVTPLQQNCTLLWCERTMRGAFVDPGGDIERLEDQAARRGVTIEKLLITHGHVDHCGEAGLLAQKLGVPIEGPHEADDFWIQQAQAVGAQYGLPRARPFVPDRWLHGGDEVQVGLLTLGVRHCPGHTPGHVIFHHALSHLAIVGDVLFHGSIGRTDFPRGDHQALLNAIVTQLWPLGDETRFVPGHGPMSNFGWERQNNPFVSDAALGPASQA